MTFALQRSVRTKMAPSNSIPITRPMASRRLSSQYLNAMSAGSLVRSARTGLPLSPRRNTHTPHRCALALARRSTRSARSRRRPRVVTRRKQGPIQFLENNPIQSSFWVRYVPQDKEKLGSPSNCKVPSGVQLPPAAALRRSHTDGRRPPPFPRDSCVSWHTVNLRSAASSAIIRTSEHFHVFSPPPRLSVRMFGSGGKKRANASSNCAAL
jgi:hypothetical protein